MQLHQIKLSLTIYNTEFSKCKDKVNCENSVRKVPEQALIENEGMINWIDYVCDIQCYFDLTEPHIDFFNPLYLSEYDYNSLKYHSLFNFLDHQWELLE